MPETTSLRVVLSHVGSVPPQIGWGMAAHAHSNFHELILVLRGTLETHIQGLTLRGQRGDALFYPQGVVHVEQAIGEEVLETLFLGWQWPEQPGEWRPAKALLINDRAGRIHLLLRWMRELQPPSMSENPYILNHLLAALLYEFSQLAQPPEQNMVLQIKSYIQRHLAEPLNLEQLAKQVGLSKYHFSREFKRRSGLTPMAFLRQERVEAARSLLLSTPWTQQAIASQVGLADEYQLSRVFRRLTGKPPSQIRRKGAAPPDEIKPDSQEG